MAAISQPACNLVDVKERCSKVFRMPEFRLIAWAGVFGSFSRGDQTVESDVDFIVGFREGTSGDDFYCMEDLNEHLRLATQREVDILYMYNKQSLGFVKAQALITGKTVYESEEWLQNNRLLAERLMEDAHRRMTIALQLGNEISQQAMVTTPEDTSTLEELARSVAELTATLLPRDSDAKIFCEYFSPLYSWTREISGIVQQCQASGAVSLNIENRQLLLQFLTQNLPERMRALEHMYMPVVEDVLSYAKSKREGS